MFLVSPDTFLNANAYLYHSLILVHSELCVKVGDTVLDMCDKNKPGKCNPKLEIRKGLVRSHCFLVLHCSCKVYVQLCTISVIITESSSCFGSVEIKNSI